MIFLNSSEGGILIRLHWGNGNAATGNALSTITLYRQAGQSKLTLGSKYLVAIAQNSLVLEEFASEMVQNYNAKLVAVSHRPLTMTFLHNSDVHTTVFTTNSDRLKGIMKGLITRCYHLGENEDFQLSLEVGKGSNAHLVQSSLCNCLIEKGERVHHEELQTDNSVKTMDTCCQSDLTFR